MGKFDRKQHWEKIFSTRSLDEVSWYQPIPSTSLELIQTFDLPKTSKIIDVGGGDSFLVDHLLEQGFTDITVLDISQKAIDRAKHRLREKAGLVNWIQADAASFEPTEKYDVWHDRAAFHFLTNEMEIEHYIAAVHHGLKPSGALILGTFSTEGPTKCSGIEIKQYSEQSMIDRLGSQFEKIRCFTVDHPTPFDTVQNFQFCTFRTLPAA